MTGRPLRGPQRVRLQAMQEVDVEVALVATDCMVWEHLPNFFTTIFNRPLFTSRRIRFLSAPSRKHSTRTALSDLRSSEPLRYFRHIFRLHHGLRRSLSLRA